MCKQYLQTPLPAEATNIAAPKTWPDCESYKSYSGIGRTVDYVAARKCAWAERLATQKELEPQYTIDSVVGGSGMLAVLYANGEGVERNTSLAKRFACEARIPGAFSDIDKAGGGDKVKFCDEVRTTMEIGFCAAWGEELSDQERHAAFDAMISNWTAEQKRAFTALAKTDESYAEAHAGGELDTSGSGRAIWELDEEADFKQRFTLAIQKFESGDLPAGTAKDAATADAQLNAVYQKAVKLADAGKFGYGAVQPDGIRKTEQAWIRYRDVWLRFAKLRYPATPASAWLTLITKDRTDVLKATLCEIDADARGSECTDEGEPKPSRPLP